MGCTRSTKIPSSTSASQVHNKPVNIHFRDHSTSVYTCSSVVYSRKLRVLTVSGGCRGQEHWAGAQTYGSARERYRWRGILHNRSRPWHCHVGSQSCGVSHWHCTVAAKDQLFRLVSNPLLDVSKFGRFMLPVNPEVPERPEVVACTSIRDKMTHSGSFKEWNVARWSEVLLPYLQ